MRDICQHFIFRHKENKIPTRIADRMNRIAIVRIHISTFKKNRFFREESPGVLLSLRLNVVIHLQMRVRDKTPLIIEQKRLPVITYPNR